MTINSKFKSLITVALLISFSGFAEKSTTISTKDSNNLAPEATAAEAAISFWDLPYLKQAFIDSTPADRKDSISVGELGIDGGNKAMILNLAQEIADKKHGDYDSLLIAHQGKLLFESYYLRGRINLAHGQSSAVKGYTSLALGRAIQMGYLNMADLDKPLVSFLKDLDPTKFVEGAEKITLHKALTMHGGLSVSDEKWEELEKNPAALKGQGLVQTLLEHSGPITQESQSYLYGNFNPMMVMTVIDAVVPGTAKDFIKNEILDKLGITNYSWETHVSGLPQAGWMVSMTSRDMLKLGILVSNNGQWQGEQLIPADYLAKATSGLVKPTQDWMPESYRYGYFWYQTNITVGDKSYDAKFAWGGGGQRVIALAELDLTIVITGHDREDTLMTQVSEIIIPAFVHSNMSEVSYSQDKLTIPDGPYLGQKPPGSTPEIFAPGIVNTAENREIEGMFATDMKAFYFIKRPIGEESNSNVLAVIEYKNNQWLESVAKQGVSEPSISPDGRIIYFATEYMERTSAGWSELTSLGEPFENIAIMRLSASSNGTYYFDTYTEKLDTPLRYSRLIDGKYQQPKSLGKQFAIGKYNAHPFIAPDESYIIFDSIRDSGYGTSDLYISYRASDDSWGPAINMGDKINTSHAENYPSVSPDGKFILFDRREKSRNNTAVDIYWVDAKIIEDLRPES